MKIGILTYHRVINDGSILQTYALHRLLSERHPDATVEVIDCMPWKLRRTELRGALTRRPPFLRWDFLRKYDRKRRDLASFMETHLALSPRFVGDDLARTRAFVERQRYDAIVVGSDTVWEARTRGSSVPAAPNIYYLPGIEGPRKLSFAASADPVHPEVARDAERSARIAPHLSDFAFISYRDEATRSYLESLGLPAEELRFMPDPTVLSDIRPVVTRQPKPAELVAAVSLPKASAEGARQQLEHAGFAVADLGVAFGGPFPSLDRIGERLGAFARLSALVTDRFHSSIFTLTLSGCPVIFVEEAAKWPAANSKGRDLFRRLDLEFMVVRHSGGPFPDGVVEERLAAWQARSPDVGRQLQRLREASVPTLRQMDAVLRGDDAP